MLGGVELPFLSPLLKVRFVRDLLTLQVGKAVPTLCGFLSSIIFPNLLGLGGYGRYAVVLSLVGVLGLVTNLGQQHSVQAFLAEAFGRKDTKAMRAVSRYYVLASIISIGIMGIFLPFLPVIAERVYGDASLGTLAQLVFIASMLDPLYNYLCLVLQTVREIRLLTILENAYITLQLGISVLLVTLGWGVSGILWGSLITSALSLLVGLVMLPSILKRNGMPKLRSLAGIDFNAFRMYGGNGFWIAIDKNIANLYPNLFLFALSLRSSEEAVGLVRLAFKYGNLPASFVLSNISRLASSVVPTLIGQGTATLRKSLIKLMKSTVALHLLATIAAGIAVPIFFPLVYGRGFGDALRPFWVVLLLHTGLAVHALLTPILRVKNRVYLATAFNVTGLALGIGAFFLTTANSLLTPLWAFSLALTIYHVVSLGIVFPSIRLIRAR